MRYKFQTAIYSVVLLLCNTFIFGQPLGRGLFQARRIVISGCSNRPFTTFTLENWSNSFIKFEEFDEASNNVFERYSDELKGLDKEEQIAAKQEVKKDLASLFKDNGYPGFKQSYTNMENLTSEYEALGMSRSEAAAIREQTSNSGRFINDIIRGELKWNSSSRGFKYLLDEAISKLPVYTEEAPLYRAASALENTASKGWKIGDLIDNDIYLSTSKDLTYANGIADNARESYGELNARALVLKISSNNIIGVEIPAWLDALPSSQNEVLFKPPSQFKILDEVVEEDPDPPFIQRRIVSAEMQNITTESQPLFLNQLTTSTNIGSVSVSIPTGIPAKALVPYDFFERSLIEIEESFFPNEVIRSTTSINDTPVLEIVDTDFEDVE